jgi:tetratricopeptide (TPR) repeat protein
VVGTAKRRIARAHSGWSYAFTPIPDAAIMPTDMSARSATRRAGAIGWVALVLSVGPSRIALAEDVDPGQRAEAVHAAAASPEGRKELERLAVANDVDPWLVVDRLDAATDYDTAAKFAALLADPNERTQLTAYVTARRGGKSQAQIRAVIETAEASIAADDAKGAFEALAKTEPPSGGVLSVMHAYVLGEALVGLHRPVAAGDAYFEASQAAHRVGWTRLELDALGRAADLASATQSYATARTRTEALLAMREGEPPSESQFGILAMLGDIAAETGDYPSALAYYQRARTVAEKSRLDALVWKAGASIAMVRLATGATEEAYTRLSEAEARLAELGNDGVERDAVRLGMGALYFAVGDYDQAIHWSDLVASSRAHGDLANEGVALGNVGVSQHMKGLFREADETLRKALGCFEQAGDASLRLQWSFNHAEVLADRGDHVAALAWFDDLLAHVKGTGVPQLEVVAHTGHAASLISTGKPAEAIRELEAVRSEADRLQLRGAALRIDAKLAIAALATGDLDHALGIARAVAGRIGLAGPEVDLDGDLVAKARSEALLAGMTAAIRKGDIRAAQQLLEADRGERLVEALGGRWLLLRCSVPDEFAARERLASAGVREAGARFREADAVLASAKGENEIARARQAIEVARRARKNALLDLQAATDASNVASRRSALDGLLSPRRVSVDELRARLAPKEAFVYLSIGPAGAWAMVLTADAERVVLLDGAKLDEAVNGLTYDTPDAIGRKSLITMRAELLDRLALPADTKHVTFCPDETAISIPFGAMMQATPCSIVPSATTYEMLARTRTRRGKGAIAIGNPSYAPSSTSFGLAALTDRLGDKHLDALPGTAKEVPLAAPLSTDTRLLAVDATKSKLLAAIRSLADSGRRGAVLHVGCHGLLDVHSALRSALALTPEKDDAGVLTAFDVLKIQAPFDVVVLSACQSGAGRVRRGDGVPGLVRAFLQAGAGTVVASVYRVDDKATQRFMSTFYALLWAGAPPADALAKAQTTVGSDAPPSAHPWVIFGVPSSD